MLLEWIIKDMSVFRRALRGEDKIAIALITFSAYLIVGGKNLINYMVVIDL
jgi:hypothetical protein